MWQSNHLCYLDSAIYTRLKTACPHLLIVEWRSLLSGSKSKSILQRCVPFFCIGILLNHTENQYQWSNLLQVPMRVMEYSNGIVPPISIWASTLHQPWSSLWLVTWKPHLFSTASHCPGSTMLIPLMRPLIYFILSLKTVIHSTTTTKFGCTPLNTDRTKCLRISVAIILTLEYLLLLLKLHILWLIWVIPVTYLPKMILPYLTSSHMLVIWYYPVTVVASLLADNKTPCDHTCISCKIKTMKLDISINFDGDNGTELVLFSSDDKNDQCQSLHLNPSPSPSSSTSSTTPQQQALSAATSTVSVDSTAPASTPTVCSALQSSSLSTVTFIPNAVWKDVWVLQPGP